MSILTLSINPVSRGKLSFYEKILVVCEINSWINDKHRNVFKFALTFCITCNPIIEADNASQIE